MGELTNEQEPVLKVRDCRACDFFWCRITNRLGYTTASDICRVLIAGVGVQPEPVIQPRPSSPLEDVEDMEGVQEGKETRVYFFALILNFRI